MNLVVAVGVGLLVGIVPGIIAGCASLIISHGPYTLEELEQRTFDSGVWVGYVTGVVALTVIALVLLS